MGRSAPRCSRLSARMRARPTSSIARCPSSTPAAASAASAGRRSSSGASMRSISIRSVACWRRGAAQRRRLLLGVLVVRGHDPLHELVAHHVLAAEAHELDPLDVLEDVADHEQPGALVARQVDLGDVAGHDHLRVEPEPREEHLDLLGARVLGLVEDDEAVVERSAAHEGQRRHLDHAALQVLVDLLGLEHVVERVEERAQVGVDLGGDVAGQEAEPLAGLDGRAGEDDPVHLAARRARRPPSPRRGTTCRCRPDRCRP